ncbi:MAG: cytochrome c biogenesis protein CcdA [Elusimicrobia bacterium]|nr:cytochrome c biogenesis protein CcdA [Elusimicrobiota bacterium]
MAINPGAWAAFVAGVASFLSPCVLPLVPGYISFISGLSLEELSQGHDRRAVMRQAGVGSVFFVLGFTLVFTALGASASAIGSFLAQHLSMISRFAGALIMLFGLHISGILPIKWLYYEKRLSASAVKPSAGGAFLMGLAFAFGWTPCIGPILASILALAATQETVRQGMTLLAIYSLGLGIPFILTALAINGFLQFFARYKRYIRWGEIGAGVLLIVIGALVFTNRLTLLVQLLPRSLYQFAL